MKELNISDIISDSGVFTDGDWVESKDQNPKGSVRLIQLADIGDGYFVNKSQRFLTKEAAVRLKCTFLKKGDILIARMPDPIGRACIFPDIGQDAVTVVDVCVVRPKKENVFTPFVKYLINSPTFRYKISKHITGTTRKRISRRNLNKIGFVLPPLTDQKRIVKVLSDCEQLIQWRKESIRLLDDYLESTFLEMFGDSGTNPRKFDLRTLAEFYIDKKNGTKCGPFGSALKKHEYVSDGVPVWNMDNISKRGRFINKPRLFITNNKFNFLAGYSVINGDIIISRAGTVGKMCEVNSEYPKSIISTNLIRLRLDSSRLLPLYFISLMTFCKGRIGRLKTGPDGGFTHMNTGILDKLKFPYPPIGSQLKYKAIVDSVKEIQNSLSKSLKELNELYSSISQKAFKGELNLDKINIEESEVSVIENKEVLHGRTVFADETRIRKRIDFQNKKGIEKRDISNLSLLDFLEFPYELYKDKIADDYAPELDFINDDLFYQFYLKDNFNTEPFTFSDLQSKFNSYYIPKGKDFDPVKWKSLIFKYLEAKKPLIEQSFEVESGTIKLKLTDEAFKA